MNDESSRHGRRRRWRMIGRGGENGMSNLDRGCGDEEKPLAGKELATVIDATLQRENAIGLV